MDDTCIDMQRNATTVTANHVTAANHGPKQELFDERHHGADAQKGWNYQIVATAWKAFELDRTPANPWSIQLEGIEDFDVASIQQLTCSPGKQYVQAKSSGDGLNWTVACQVVASFLRDAQVDSTSSFLLVTDHPLTGSAKQLCQFRDMGEGKERKNILHLATTGVQGSLRKQHRDAAWVTEKLVGRVLEKMDVEVVDSTELLNRVTSLVDDSSGSGTEGARAYIHYIAGRLFDCARDRRTINHDTLAEWKLDLERLLQHTQEMTAIKCHLVRLLEWKPDKCPQDFLEGRQTRIGHVFQNLDIVRNKWMDLISRAFEKNACVVICAPSGEGKSTLAFRYVHDHWKDDTVVRVVGAASRPDAEAVSEYLRRLQTTYHDVRVLLDNVDKDTGEWATIAAECQAAGISMLITTRTEDWYRFRRPDKVDVALIEPVLDGPEAVQLFDQLRRHERVHNPLQTPEEAFEQVQPSGLLMEFMYFVTHGSMLTDRLEQQLREIQARCDPEEAKRTLWLLMTVSLASLLGCGVSRQRLLGTDSGDRLLRERTLESLCGEYIAVDGDMVRGLHSIRSRDIVKAFRETPVGLANRTIELLPFVPDQDVSHFVTYATECSLIDRQSFLGNLPAAIRHSKPSVVSGVLDGLYYIGERDLVQRNLQLFQEARNAVGSQGPDMLTWFILPHDGSRIADDFEKTMKPGQETNFTQLKSIASQIDQSCRGVNLCREMLHRLEEAGTFSLDVTDVGGSGRLLHWCGLLGLRPECLSQQLPQYLSLVRLASTNMESLCDLSAGLYEWDQDLHKQWMDSHAGELLDSYVKSADCTSASLEDNELRIRFITGLSGQSPNEEVMSKLDIGRELFPHCQRYCSQGFLADAAARSILPPSYDPTTKNIPVSSYPARRNVWINHAQTRAICSVFDEDSNARYVSSWTAARNAVLVELDNIVQAASRMLEKNELRLVELRDPVLGIGTVSQSLPARAPETVLFEDPQSPRQLPEQKWGNNLYSFFNCFADVIMGEAERISVLLMTGRSLVEALHPMQDALKQRSAIVSDHLDQLVSKESYIYPRAMDAIRVLFTDFPLMHVHSPESYLTACHKKAVQQALQRYSLLAAECASSRVATIIPTWVDIDQELLSVAIGVDTADICHFDTNEGNVVTNAMTEAFDQDVVWLVPLINGETVSDQAYRVHLGEIQGESRGPRYLKAMEDLPSSLRQQLPVSSGAEPLSLIARQACAVAAACIMTVYNLLIEMHAIATDSVSASPRRVNSTPFAEAMDIAKSNYHEALGQLSERLLNYPVSSTDAETIRNRALGHASAVTALLSEVSASMSPEAWAQAAEPTLTLLGEESLGSVMDS